MGTCIGNRNTYRDSMQKSCSTFENRLRLSYRDWKHSVGAINSYCPEDGTVPKASIEYIMDEIGLTPVYKDKNSHLEELLDEFLKDRVSERKWLIYLALFLCGGDESSKLEYLCQTINNKDMTKSTIPGSELRKILESLMELSVLIIPRLGKIEEHKERISKVEISEAVDEWWPDNSKDIYTFEEVQLWGRKCRSFTTGEARAAMLKLALGKKDELPSEREVEVPTTNAPEDNLIAGDKEI